MGFIGAGIDVSKRFLDAAVQGERKILRVTNDAAGFAQLAEWLGGLGVDQVILEATGGYEQAALDALYKAGLPVVRVNPRQVRDFAKAVGQLAKTDRLDARILAHMASVIELIRYRPLDEKTLRLKQFHLRRTHLIGMITAEKQRRRQITEPSLRKMLNEHIRRLETERGRLNTEIAAHIKGSLQARVLGPMKGVGQVFLTVDMRHARAWPPQPQSSRQVVRRRSDCAR